MSKLLIIPSFFLSRPRFLWGIVIGVVFGWLFLSCGFTLLPGGFLPVQPAAESTPTPLPSAHQQTEFTLPTPTPLPAEYQATPDQTTGIILGASVLVLVILIGTLSAFRAQKKKS